MRLQNAQDFLRYASGVALVISSVALLVFSLSSATVKAAPARAIDNGYHAVGAVVKDGVVQVIGYKPASEGAPASAIVLANYR
jgi:hypothetical protein